MMFSESFLDELRSRLPVSEVVGRRVKLTRRGSEYVGLSPFKEERSPSFTVNDDKRFYHDFSSGKHGDIFSFLQEVEGLDFRAAVETLAAQAGLPLPADGSKQKNGSGPKPSTVDHRNDDEPPFEPDAYDLDRASPAPAAAKSAREITRTYDYATAGGDLLYQVCRIEWTDEYGARKKTFLQRRPDGHGHWIWGLSKGEYLRGRDGDWYQATKQRLEKWKGAERRVFADDVKHSLYRLTELRELAGDETTIYLPEGEKDVDNLLDIGLVATTNSGGAKNWRADMAEVMRGRDVVILQDNDEAGRKRSEVVASSLVGIARRIRILDFAAIWENAPKGADVSDWIRQREGTAEELEEIARQLPDWRPAPFVSHFGGLAFEDLDAPGPEHAYVIDGWMTVGDKSVVGGASLSGKSFLAIHMAMCVATARDFFGHRVLAPGLVVYQAGEGGRGIKKRFRAWRQYFGVPKDRRVPLYILTSRVDIHSPDGDVGKLIEELKGVSRLYGMPVITLFIDTLAKASGAADENSGRDMGVVMANVDRIAEALPGCHICLVHHMNAGGTKLRGHTSVYAGVDQVILVSKDEESKVRRAVLDKQKDDESGSEIRFELHAVEIGHRQVDGKPITSCVTLPVGGPVAVTVASGRSEKRTIQLTNQQQNILTALKSALADHGEAPDPALKLPKSIATVVRYQRWMDAYRAIATEADDAAVRKAMQRAGEKLYALRIIGRINPYVWLTGRATIEVPFQPQGSLTASMPPPVQEEFPDDLGRN